MSPFNQCLVVCETGPAKEYFRLIYWSRNAKNSKSKEIKRVRACKMRETLSQKDIERAHRAMKKWNLFKPNAKLSIPRPTQFDDKILEESEKRIRALLNQSKEEN